jgi:hypothetical protein
LICAFSATASLSAASPASSVMSNSSSAAACERLCRRCPAPGGRGQQAAPDCRDQAGHAKAKLYRFHKISYLPRVVVYGTVISSAREPEGRRRLRLRPHGVMHGAMPKAMPGAPLIRAMLDAACGCGVRLRRLLASGVSASRAVLALPRARPLGRATGAGPPRRTYRLRQRLHLRCFAACSHARRCCA